MSLVLVQILRSLTWGYRGTLLWQLVCPAQKNLTILHIANRHPSGSVDVWLKLYGAPDSIASRFLETDYYIDSLLVSGKLLAAQSIAMCCIGKGCTLSLYSNVGTSGPGGWRSSPSLVVSIAE